MSIMPIRLNDSDLTDIDFPVSPTVGKQIPLPSRFLGNLEQETDNGCWVVCADLIIGITEIAGGVARKSTNSQCSLAGAFIGGICCDISDKTKTDCDVPMKLEEIKEKYKTLFGIDSDILPPKKLASLDREVLIREQIDKGSPVEIYMLVDRQPPEEDSAHLMVVYGWVINDLNQFCLLIKDPKGNDNVRTLDEVVKGDFTTGRWVAAIIILRK